MAISTAVQLGSRVHVYNERNAMVADIHAGTGPNAGLKGFPQPTVSIQSGSRIYTYNEKGTKIGDVYAD